jgi:hypothetical protein
MVNYYWSKRPGTIVNKTNGKSLTGLSEGLNFHGSAEEWNETLIETILDVRNQVWRERQIMFECDIEVSFNALALLENSILYKGSLTREGDGPHGSIRGMEVFQTFRQGYDIALLERHTRKSIGTVTILD